MFHSAKRSMMAIWTAVQTGWEISASLTARSSSKPQTQAFNLTTSSSMYRITKVKESVSLRHTSFRI